MVLRFISIISMCLFHVMGSPQLKLGHSGYELISINDQNADDSIPLSSKLTLESASRYSGIGALNLEKVTEPIDEDDGFSAVLHQHKRHYDPNRSSSEAKAISESHSNMIDVTNKQSTNKKPNIYLALGIPRTFTHPTASVKETQTVAPISEKSNQNSQSKETYEDSDSSEESGSQQKVNTKLIQTKINDKTSKPTAKSSKSIENMSEKNANQESEIVSSTMFESEFADSKDAENITNLMADFQRVWDLFDAKSDFHKKEDKIEPPTVKSGFTMVTHFPSLRIHHQKNAFVSRKSPSMFSPIYTSDFDFIAGNPHKKSAVPIKELHGKNLRIDHKNPKSSREIGKSYEEKMGERIPSVLVLNNMNRDRLNPKIGSHIPFPILRTNYNAQPLLNQRPMKQMITHLEINSIPLATNHFDSSLPTTGSSIFDPQSRWEETAIDVKKEEMNGETREMHDVSHPHNSRSTKSSCNQMKPSTPAFYQFLAKFSNTVLSKALEYESDTQAQDSASKLIEATKNKNLDDDIVEFLA